MAGKVEGLGPDKLAGKVRAHAEWLDQHGAVARNELARRWIGDPDADMSLRRIFPGLQDHQVAAWGS